MVPEPGGSQPPETRPFKMLTPGVLISHYRIIEKIGQGGMGVVYRAEDTKLKRNVALKFLPPYLTQDAGARERFIHEARAASALDHHNICTIYEIEETGDGHTFIAMACYEGETLRQRMGRGLLDLDEALDIGLQLSEGLTRAHSKGIVHRDLKPSNIMITSDSVVKIMDFGLAKLSGRTRITKTGTAVGTPAYMSPEQAQGKEVDQRSDIFSFGVILYEMVAGRPPFKGDYDAAVLHSILHDSPEQLSNSRPGTPGRLQRIVSRTLEKDAGKRYQSSSEVAVDLAQLREETRTGVTRGPQRLIGRKRLIIPAIAVLAIVLASVAIWRYGPEEGVASRLRALVSGDPAPRLQAAREELFTIVIAPFWGATEEAAEEGKVMQALVERQLRDELGGEAGVRILSDAVSGIPRSEEDARTLGKELDAVLVIWGEVFSLHGEVEIQPYLTRVNYDWAPLEPSTSALEADLSQSSQLAMRRAKAEEVGKMSLLAAAFYYDNRQAHDKALAILRRIKPRSTMSIVAEAWIEFERNRPAEAESLCYEAASLDSLDPYPHYTLGAFYSRLGRYGEAVPRLERALALEPEHEEFRWQLALAYTRTGDEKGLAIYRETVDAGTENSMSHARLGYLYRVLDRYDEAIQECKLASRLEPDNHWRQYGLGLVYEAADSLQRAEKAFKKAQDMADTRADRASISWGLGRLYRGQDRHDEAIAEFNRAIALRPANAFYYTFLLDSYHSAGRGDEGLRIIQDAVEANPEDAEFHRVLGGEYRRINRSADAIASYKEALRLKPNVGDSHMGLGVAYSDSGLFALAASCYKSARDLGVRYWQDFAPAINLHRTYLAQGLHEEAEEEILRSLEAIPRQSPWHANASAELGVAYTYQGRYEQAAAEFKAIIEADPFVYYHLFYALSLHRVGRAEESRVYLRELAGSFEGDPWERSLLDFLTGEMDEATLLSLAKSEDPKTEREQECEAFYYIGTAYLLETDAVLESGHPDTAKAQAYFEKCLGTGIWQFLEYFSARGELDRLKRN